MIRYGRNPAVVVGPSEDISHNRKGTYSKPRVTVAPTLDATTAGVGSFLTLTPGTWLNAVSVTFEWQRDGQFIKAGGLNYTIVLADVGHTVTVLERATNASGGASSRTAGVVVT